VLIAEALLGSASRKFHRNGLHFSREARNAIESHTWPGNVRELANAVQRAALLAESDTVEPHDLALGSAALPAGRSHTGGGAPASSVESLTFDFAHGSFTAEAVEERLIREALRHERGNVSRAAKLLGMNRSSLRYRIERYKLDEYIQEVAAS
jgi:DNA-binding NtrC family response regulator